jgi:hypothetical protein
MVKDAKPYFSMLRKLPLFLFVLISFSGFTQNPLAKKVSFNIQEQTIEQVFLKLEKEGGFHFSYNTRLIKPTEKVSIKSNGMMMGDLLKEMLGEDLVFLHRGSYVIIKSNPEKGKKNDYNIHGSITDSETGETITHVTVYEVEKFKSALSDEAGKYDISVSNKEGFVDLAISRKHYRDTVVRISTIEPQPLNIPLTPDTNLLQNQTRPLDSSALVGLFLNDRAYWNMSNVSLSEVKPFQISLFPMIGTNRLLSGKVSNKTSINLVAGYSYGVEGFEVGGVFNVVRNQVVGLQIAGFGNVVGGETDGTQLSGFMNLNKRSVDGLQLAGFTNIVSDTASGVQVAGAINVTKNVQGVQVAGAVNINSDRVKGTQVSGLFNYTKRLAGIQVGFINIADTIESGGMFGIINYVRKGFHQFEMASNDVLHANLLFKTGTHHFYNILGVATRFDGDASLWAYQYGFGTQFNWGKKWYSDIEVVSSSIHPFDGWVDGLNLLGDLNFTLGYQLSKKLSINLGPVYHVYITRLLNPDTGELGYNFANNPFYDTTTNGTKVQMWVGYKAALRF